MSRKKTIRIGAVGREILEPRLEVPEALAEAIGRDETEVDAACDELLEHLAAGGIPTRLGELERQVMIDAVDGSTILWRWVHGWPRERSRIFAAADRLEQALEPVLGPVCFPRPW